MLSKRDYDLLVLYREERPYPENEDDQERFERFRTNDWVRDTRFETLQSGGIIAPLNPTHFVVSETGADLLAEFEQAQKSAKQARARFWITTAIAAIGVAAAIVKCFFG